jgi:hypothetical protein
MVPSRHTPLPQHASVKIRVFTSTYKPEGRGFDSWWVIGFFSGHNPSSRTVTLGSTQLLTEMSTRNLPGVKGDRVVRLTSSSPFVRRLSRKYGNLNVSQPCGSSWHVTRTVYLAVSSCCRANMLVGDCSSFFTSCSKQAATRSYLQSDESSVRRGHVNMIDCVLYTNHLWSESLKVRDYLEDLGVDRRLILKLILTTWGLESSLCSSGSS